ncbi:hypothetical protein BC332_27983 [Capsicum chinense]|nr:hypothetical protein BC332_27983 [Capsicum chinense]
MLARRGEITPAHWKLDDWETGWWRDAVEIVFPPWLRTEKAPRRGGIVLVECSTCKYQDCNVKHDGLISAINALPASVKEMASKRGVISSKRISYPYTLLDIKVDKRRRKDTSKALSSIKKGKIAMPLSLSLSCTIIQSVRIIGEQHKLKKSEVSRNEECLINIIKGFSIPDGLPWHLVDEVYISINYGDEFHWVLAVIVLKERRIQFYDLMLRRRCFGPSSKI